MNNPWIPPEPTAEAAGEPAHAERAAEAEAPRSGSPTPASTTRTGRSRRRIALELALLLLVAAVLPASRGGWYQARPFATLVPLPGEVESRTAADRKRRIASVQPRGTWVVVDTYSNRLRVYRGGELEREAIVSTGSGTILRDPVSDRSWVFDTPKGERQVQRKVQNPVWIKPDWAFIEEGFEPPTRWRDRVDSTSLGDFGIYRGDGDVIHGPRFQTLLGQRVPHGCIRVGDEDLEWIYWRLPMGARVYLY